MKRICLIGYAIAIIALACSAFVRAQTVTFEQLGDFPIDASAFVFDSTGVLFASGSSAFYSYEPHTNTWFEVLDNYSPDRVIALNPDTLVADERGVEISTDGGQSWTEVFDSSQGLYQTPSGLLLSGMGTDRPGIAYSVDRGDTWQEAEFPELMEEPQHSGEDFLILPPGHSHAGRLVSAGRIGMAYSDDDGQTWVTSDIWVPFRYWGYSIALARSGRILAVINDNGNPDGGFQLYKSEDGGETWIFLDSFGIGEPGLTHLLTNDFGYSLSDGSLLILTGGGKLLRTIDEGNTWTQVGTVPVMVSEGESIQLGVLVGPDEHVYAGVIRSGSQFAWAFRSNAPVLVSNEPNSVPQTGQRLRVYPNPTTDFITIKSVAEDVEILDVLGRVILKAESSERIDVSMLPLGTYLIKAGNQTQVLTIVR